MKTLTLIIVLLVSFNAFSSVISIIVIRHAEKQGGSDPGLTEKGMQRADSLIELGKIFEIKGIYSSQAKRSIQTATPLARFLNIEINSSIAAPCELLADIVGNYSNESVLVVGHSDTVPDFINCIIDNINLKWIDEANFSNMYIVHFDEESKKHQLQRYEYEPMPDATFKLIPMPIHE